jgi:cobalamin 5'-phosphate synthase/cobalamin synthase
MRPGRSALAAITFLTRLPGGRRIDVSGADVGAAAPLFPLVGAAVGGACGLVADALVPALPSLVAGAIAVALGAILTGALHLDALADTADALGAGTRERALEIMRDSALGAFGVVALSVIVVVDAATLGSLAETNDAAIVAIGAGAAGRAFMLPAARVLPYARSGPGLGRVLEGLGLGSVALALVFAVAFAVPARGAGLAGCAAAAAVAAALGFAVHRWLGGTTGDVMGATAKLAETAFLVTALAVTT